MEKLRDWPKYLAIMLALMDVVGGVLWSIRGSFMVFEIWHMSDRQRDYLKWMPISEITAVVKGLLPSNEGAWKISISVFNYDIAEVQRKLLAPEYEQLRLKIPMLIVMFTLYSAFIIQFSKTNDDLFKSRISRLLYKCFVRTVDFLIFLFLCILTRLLSLIEHSIWETFFSVLVKDWMPATGILCIFLVLSLSKFLCGVSLLLAMFKGWGCCNTVCLKFKCIVVTLTVFTFLALSWHLPPTEFCRFFERGIGFLFLNGLFLIIFIIKKNLKKDALKSMEEVLQTLKLEDVIAPGGILERWATFIEENGLQTEGLYRVPGNKTEVDILFSTWAENQNADIQSLNLAVNVFATALKELVAKTISPVIPMGMIKDVERIAVIANADDRLQELKVFLYHLPPPNLTALKIVIQHLTKVAARSEENQKSSKNLANLWWPIIIPFIFTDIVKLGEMQSHLENLVTTMIDQCADIFGGMDNSI